MVVLPQSLGCILPNPIPPMRLTPGQLQTILATTQDLTGAAVEVYLFGSRTHLASLLEAIQRCVYFLKASRRGNQSGHGICG